MVDLETARNIAADFLQKQNSNSTIELELIENPILSGDYGWVFGYNSAEYLRTKSLSSALAGNAPILVEKETGNVVTTGTARPLESYIDSYIEFGDPNVVAGTRIALLSVSQAISQPITIVKTIRDHCKMGLADAKKVYEDCMQGRVVNLNLTSVETARRTALALQRLGLEVRRLPAEPDQ